MNFATQLENNINNVGYTENGANVYNTTNSKLLDWFSKGGALRAQTDQTVTNMFDAAFHENPLLALKSLFYFRDIRGGQGERKTFRTVLTYLATRYPEALQPNVKYIPTYGRWDDLYAFVGTELEDEAFTLIDLQLSVDLSSDKPSLMAKWLASENASSAKTKQLARITRKHLNMSSVTYRKTLSKLRNQIGLVEQQMSKKQWSEIVYDKIPSRAGMVYRKAFNRNDSERYQQFLNAVAEGKKKINAGTLYPYDIVGKCLRGDQSETLNEMWKALPDYFEGKQTNGVVVADTSGSMHGQPLEVAISLAMYVAERNTGPYANKFISFSRTPTMHTIEGSSIYQKVKNLNQTEWDYDTNLQAVFNVILDTAIKHKTNPEEIPAFLYIVSDMQFNQAITGSKNTKRLFEIIEQRYTKYGYKMPFLVFWNVRAVPGNQPMSMDDRGFQMVSGCSPSIFSSLLKHQTVDAYQLMLEVLQQPRYDAICLGDNNNNSTEEE